MKVSGLSVCLFVLIMMFAISYLYAEDNIVKDYDASVYDDLYVILYTVEVNRNDGLGFIVAPEEVINGNDFSTVELPEYTFSVLYYLNRQLANMGMVDGRKNHKDCHPDWRWRVSYQIFTLTFISDPIPIEL